MPQLNIADFAPQLVWLAITFVLMYIMMAKVAMPRIAEVLENRQNRISTDLAEAKKLSEDSDKAKADYEAALSDARSRAHAMVAELKAGIAKDQNVSKAELEATLAVKANAAEESINKAKEAALQNIRQIAMDTAKLTVSKLVAVDISDVDATAAVEASMKGGA